MNYAGCKRKFDVDAYVLYVKRLRIFTMVVGKWTAHEERSMDKKAEELRGTNLRGNGRNQVRTK